MTDKAGADKKPCEFCGERKETEGTTIVGAYCIQCHQIVIEESRDAISRIKKRKAALRAKGE